MQFGGVGPGLVEDPVGKMPVAGVDKRSLILCQRFAIRVGDGGFVKFLLTEKPADHLAAECLIETEDGLGRCLPNQLKCLPGVPVSSEDTYRASLTIWTTLRILPAMIAADSTQRRIRYPRRRCNENTSVMTVAWFYGLFFGERIRCPDSRSVTKITVWTRSGGLH